MQGKNVRASFQEEACSGATVVSETDSNTSRNRKLKG